MLHGRVDISCLSNDLLVGAFLWSVISQQLNQLLALRPSLPFVCGSIAILLLERKRNFNNSARKGGTDAKVSAEFPYSFTHPSNSDSDPTLRTARVDQRLRWHTLALVPHSDQNLILFLRYVNTGA